jgi:hypothetical protein
MPLVAIQRLLREHISGNSLFIGTPFSWCVFLGKIKERSSMMGEILNEPLIKIGEAKEQLHLLLVKQNRPFGNSSYFDGIHMDITVRYDDSKILYLHTFKLLFL